MENAMAEDDALRDIEQMRKAQAEALQKAQDQLTNGNPVVKKYLETVTNPSFSGRIQELIEHPSRNLFVAAEVGMILAWWLISSRRYRRDDGAARKLWRKVTGLLTMLFLCLIAVPGMVFGKPYLDGVWAMVAAQLK